MCRKKVQYKDTTGSLGGIMIINLILLTVIIVISVLAFYYRNKAHQAQEINETNEISLYLYNITFTNSGFNEKLKAISLAIMKRLNFEYVSFFILDPYKNVGIIESNVPEFDKLELSAFAKELLYNKNNPQIIFSEKGFLPHGADRSIKYVYYIPLVENENLIGCILLEKENLDKVQKIEDTVFNSIVAAVSRAFSFIIFAYNLNESAYKDVLTGVQNRAGYELLNCDLEGSYTAVMCDIDKFKIVNDTFGHDVGDVVIKFVATALSKSIRPTDHIFRLGGEEFLLLLKGVESDMIIKRINDIRREIESNELRTDSEVVKVTVSFGLSDTSMTSKLSELTKLADKALYYSKNNGRNRATIYRDNLFS